MFKKILISLCVILVIGGLGYLGYVVFMAKSITNVEIIGNVQTLYLTDDDLDLSTGDLKVTYRNGESKLISLNNKNVKVTLFSSVVETHGIMKITYKGFTVEQPYNVLAKGMYYVSQKTVSSANSSAPNGVFTKTSSYSEKTSTEMFYLLGEGKLLYYHLVNGEWYLEDGRYDPSFNYSMQNDCLIADLGGRIVRMRAVYTENGDLFFSSVYDTTDSSGEFLKKREEAVYTHLVTKSDRRVADIKVCYTDGSSGSPFYTFYRGETLDKANIYIQVTYANDFFMHSVKVKVCSAMDSGDIETSFTRPNRLRKYLWYEGFRFEFWYTVK